MICDIVSGIPRAFPEGTDISKLTQTVRNDFAERGAFPKDAFNSEVSTEPEAESRNTGDEYEDMPFTFGESGDEAPAKSAEPARSDTELNVRWKASLSENRDANGVRLSYPSEAVRYAQQTYGNQLDSVQASAKELAGRQTVYDTEDFEALYGKDFTEVARDRVRQFKGLADDVAHGIRNVEELYEA